MAIYCSLVFTVPLGPRVVSKPRKDAKSACFCRRGILDSSGAGPSTARIRHSHLRTTSSYFGIVQRDAEENQEFSATVHYGLFIYSSPRLPLALGLALLSCHWTLPCRLPSSSSFFPILTMYAACMTNTVLWSTMTFTICHGS